jgi:hypothetical protein
MSLTSIYLLVWVNSSNGRNKIKNLVKSIVVIILFAAAGIKAQVAIIANKSVPASSIEMGKVNEIYMLKTKTWSNGAPINPVTLKSDNETCQQFFGALGRDFMEMKKFWMKLLLTGEGQPPVGVVSEEDVVSLVSSTPGAI